ncbi:hypothetical protein FRB97_002601 [Tulasnella sp. 331]|nr:hypothetical protein FRB97_002601 [Tulasnella sp. 331]KAG8883973.1 hypothetical protein FRB98_002681 [Tulasnella sp. 332]
MGNTNSFRIPKLDESFQDGVSKARQTWIEYGRSKDSLDLVACITAYKSALAILPVGDSRRSDALADLGIALRERFGRSNQLADLDDQINVLLEALPLRFAGDPDRPATLESLSVALGHRFERTKQIADLNGQVTLLEEALSLLPSDSQEHRSTLESLGRALKARFEQTEEITDLDGCVKLLQEALHSHPTGSPQRLVTLDSLSIALIRRFEKTENTTDLDHSIKYYLEDLKIRRTNDPGRLNTLSGLERGLQLRFEKKRWVSDLDKRILLLREAADLSPAHDPGRLTALSRLEIALQARYEQTQQTVDRDERIQTLREALLLPSMDDPERLSCLNNLGIALRSRFMQTGEMNDIVQSVKSHRQGLLLCTADVAGRMTTLQNLGGALRTHFRRTGKFSDLDESIENNREALSLCPTGHGTRSAALTSLGGVLKTRYKQRGEIADLNEGIKCHREALRLCPKDHPARHGALNNLGDGLRIRYGKTRKITDLNESIKCHREDLLYRPVGHPGRSLALNNFGTALKARYERTGNMADLDESIEYHRGNLLLCPTGHWTRSLALKNLGGALQLRFDQTKQKADLDESIECHREDLLLCPSGHPGHAKTLNCLGGALKVRYEQTRETAELRECIPYFRDAASHTLSKLSTRLRASGNWILTARECDHTSLADAYSSSLTLLDRSILLARNIHDRHSRLTSNMGVSGRDIAMDAASNAIATNQLCLAVEVLERGRCLMFSQLGSYRTPLDDLEAVNRRLADRFRKLSAVLEESALADVVEKKKQSAVVDAVSRYQKHVDDWDRTVGEIRKVKGFESFLQVTPYTTLQKAAAIGPIIIVNISQFRSDAIIVQNDGEPISIPLPDATPSDLKPLLETLNQAAIYRKTETKESDQRLTGVLRTVWSTIVEPIVFHLENTLKLPWKSRIWWIPTSIASSLPLHAAGTYRSGDRNLPDRYVSSYTPTLATLLRSRDGYQPVKRALGPRLLVVAQSGAEGEVHLSDVHKEVSVIQKQAKGAVVIEGDECRKDAVLAGMKDTNWVHFACHGKVHPREPFKSRFALHTRQSSLTLLDIIRTGLPQAELAFLSACHSAAGHRSTPDEVIHFAAGMLFAGFGGVIGTMWPMADDNGPVVADEFYKYMFRNGPEAVDYSDAAMALSLGVKELRRKKVPLQRWINLVHYGI